MESAWRPIGTYRRCYTKEDRRAGTESDDHRLLLRVNPVEGGYEYPEDREGRSALPDRSSEWRWVAWDTILATHDWLIAEHGGLDGIRDAGLVQSALATPQHLHDHSHPDALTPAAA